MTNTVPVERPARSYLMSSFSTWPVLLNRPYQARQSTSIAAELEKSYGEIFLGEVVVNIVDAKLCANLFSMHGVRVNSS